MAVSCPKCGRQYDVTLFQFGRSINCACGERVWFEHKLDLTETSEIRFFADVNVAGVTRWLRACGIDTAWEDRIRDGELVRRSILEKRIVLTLDKKLPDEWFVNNVLLLKNDNPIEQFVETVENFKIRRPKYYFTRCLVCNTVLRNASKQELLESVLPEIRQKYGSFRYCDNCRKVYWDGSHTRRMRDKIESIFDKAEKIDSI